MWSGHEDQTVGRTPGRHQCEGRSKQTARRALVSADAPGIEYSSIFYRNNPTYYLECEYKGWLVRKKQKTLVGELM